MKNILLLLFLFCFSAAVGQVIIPESSFSGSYDSLNYEKGSSKLIIELKEKSKPMLQRVDSMEQVIKKEEDKGLQKQLEQLIELIKNDSLSDVYNKMQQFGTKVALEINKKIAPPNFFYRLDREYYSYVTRLQELQRRIYSANTTFTNDNATTLEAKDCQMLERFPYDSLFRAMSPLGDDSEKRKQFMNELCKIYTQPVTTENVDCALYSFTRMIICGKTTDVLVRKQWKWGGVFCIHNVNLSITEVDYNELMKIKIQQAVDYRKSKPGEK